MKNKQREREKNRENSSPGWRLDAEGADSQPSRRKKRCGQEEENRRNGAASASAIREPLKLTPRRTRRTASSPLTRVCFVVMAHIPHRRRPGSEGEQTALFKYTSLFVCFFLLRKPNLNLVTKLQPKKLRHSFFIWKFNTKLKKAKNRGERQICRGVVARVSRHTQSARKDRANKDVDFLPCLNLRTFHFWHFYWEEKRLNRKKI